jgi:AraC family transcriptional regulator
MTVDSNALRARIYDDIGSGGLSQYHLSKQEIAGLLATETCHPPGFKVPRHAHDLTSFYLVLEGSLTEFSGRNRRECRMNSVTFTPSGEIHGYTFHDRGGRCFLVELTSGWHERLSIAGIAGWPAFVADHGEVTYLAARLYAEFRHEDNISPLSVEGLGLEILAAFSRAGKNEDKPLPTWLRLVRDIMQDRFLETITLSELAGQAGVHPVHLARTFRKHYRCSMGEYQRRLRVEHASRRLVSSIHPLASIALEAGFADQAHFCRVFKSHTGLTPSRYRARFSRS